MLSEEELQEVRDHANYLRQRPRRDLEEMLIVRLIDHIDSLPKPPQVFGEISQEELAEVEDWDWEDGTQILLATPVEMPYGGWLYYYSFVEILNDGATLIFNIDQEEQGTDYLPDLGWFVVMKGNPPVPPKGGEIDDL